MQWSPDRNAGFSKANPQQLYLPITIDPEYHYEAINVENQQKNLSSLLWWTRRVIAMRKNFKAFSRGSLQFLHPDNAKVLAFLREFDGETILRDRKSFALLANRRARSIALRWLFPHGSFQSKLFPHDQESALSDHTRAAYAFLVRLATANQKRTAPKKSALFQC